MDNKNAIQKDKEMYRKCKKQPPVWRVGGFFFFFFPFIVRRKEGRRREGGRGGYMVWGCAAWFGFSFGEDKVQV